MFLLFKIEQRPECLKSGIKKPLNELYPKKWTLNAHFLGYNSFFGLFLFVVDKGGMRILKNGFFLLLML